MKVKVLKLDNTTSTVELKIEKSLDSNDLSTGLALINRVKNQAQKQGTKLSKTRSDIRTGTSKPYRQKGTGRARQGSSKGPHFVGGGVAHGAKPDFTKLALNKKHKAVILRDFIFSMLSDETMQFVELGTDSKKLRDLLNDSNKTALLYSKDSTKLVLALRNLPNVDLMEMSSLSPFNLVNHKRVLVDESLKEDLVNILTK